MLTKTVPSASVYPVWSLIISAPDVPSIAGITIGVDVKNSLSVTPLSVKLFPVSKLKIKLPSAAVLVVNAGGKGGRCAEIGVWNGAFSECTLDVTQPSELVLIDPWELLAEQSSEEWNHHRHKDHAFMRQMYDHFSSCYGDLPNVVINKGFSAEVLATFPDDYFDWVYLGIYRRQSPVRFRQNGSGNSIPESTLWWNRGRG